MKAVGERERGRPAVECDETPAQHGAGRRDGQRQRGDDVEMVLATKNTTEEALTSAVARFRSRVNSRCRPCARRIF